MAIDTSVAPVTVVQQNYKQKENIWFNDGREARLLAFLREKVPSDCFVSDLPSKVLSLIDQFGVEQNYMMNVGARKGAIVTDLIKEHKPRRMIEFGSYIGYSTVLFAAAVRENGGTEYISFERDPQFARIAESIVALAGLSEIVRFVIGSSSTGLVAEHRAGRLAVLDMVFLDHYKPAYVADLKILESLGAIRKGLILVADNVIEPGNPTYLAYVRASSDKKKKWLDGSTRAEAGFFPDKTVNQYGAVQEDDSEVKMPGVPSIVYESRLVRSYEPTGVEDGLEITVCKSLFD